LRIPLALAAAAAALFGLMKLAEPGGGLLAHAAYVGRVAMLPSRCTQSLAAAQLGAPRALSVCMTFDGDARRSLLEWIYFHRIQGVERFDVFWDVVNDPVNESRFAEYVDALRPEFADGNAAGGDVYAWRRSDMASLVSRIAAASAGARAGECAASAADLTELARREELCRRVGNWTCQTFMNAVCLAAAKVRGDEWLGLFDVDEFVFAPGRLGRESVCFFGGRTEDEIAACRVPVREAPLLVGRDLPSVLRSRYSRLTSSVVVEGAAFGLAGSGLNNSGPRKGLVIEAHSRSAAYEPGGLLVPPSGFTRESCPSLVCGLCTPKKSIVRVLHAPVAGASVHHHDTGPFAVERPALGAALKLNHYPYDDIASALAKGQSRSWYRSVAENRAGIADFLNASLDESGRAFAPLLRHCMTKANGRSPECRKL